MLRTFILVLLVVSQIDCARKSVNNVRTAASDASTTAAGGSTASGSPTPPGSPTPSGGSTTKPTPATTSSLIYCYVCGERGQKACPEPFTTVNQVIEDIYIPRSAYCVVSERAKHRFDFRKRLSFRNERLRKIRQHKSFVERLSKQNVARLDVAKMHLQRKFAVAMIGRVAIPVLSQAKVHSH